MHPNPAFRDVSAEDCLAFARTRGFGQISANGPEGPLAALTPFEIVQGAPDAPVALRLHLVRSNPLARLLRAPVPALLAVHGPDAYVSPNWYGDIHDQVPTWNYIAAHFRGTARLLPTEELRAHLERVSAQFEERLAAATGARPWTLEKMSAEGYARLARQLVAVELVPTRIDGTWKLNQNKPAPARAGAAAALAAAGDAAIGSAPAVEIARQMGWSTDEA